MKVQLHPSTGTQRLWNPIIAEYYEYEDRPTVNEDGQIEVFNDCAKQLAAEYPTMTLIENDNESESSEDELEEQAAEDEQTENKMREAGANPDPETEGFDTEGDSE